MSTGRPYPWKQTENHETRQLVVKTVWNIVGLPATVIGCILSPLAGVVALAARMRYLHCNDAPSRRGWIMVGAGLVLSIVLPLPLWAWAAKRAWDAFLSAIAEANLSFSNLGGGEEIALGGTLGWLALLQATLIGPGLIFCGVGAACLGWAHHWESRRYLEEVKPGIVQKRATARLKRALASGEYSEDGRIVLGVVADHFLPWHTNRVGKAASIPYNKFSHTLIIGGTGSGKTVSANAVTDRFIQNGGGVVATDFKASRVSAEAYRRIAAANGVAYKQLVIGSSGDKEVVDDEHVWIDLFAGATPADATALCMQAFTWQAGAEYYKSQAEVWLSTLFELHAVTGSGVISTEGGDVPAGVFDFLARNVNKDAFIATLEAHRDQMTAPQFEEYYARAKEVRATEMGGLVSNIRTAQKAIGAHMRPQQRANSETGEMEVVAPISPRDVENGGVLYLGVSATDPVVVKLMGALLLRGLYLYSAQQMQRNDKADAEKSRAMMYMIDEASLLGEQAKALENIYRTSREANIWMCIVTQTLASWPPSTVAEIKTNTGLYLVGKTDSDIDQAFLATKMGKCQRITTQTNQRIEQRALRKAKMDSADTGRTILNVGEMLDPTILRSLPQGHFIAAWSYPDAMMSKPPKSRLAGGEEPEVLNDACVVQVIPRDHVLRDTPATLPAGEEGGIDDTDVPAPSIPAGLDANNSAAGSSGVAVTQAIPVAVSDSDATGDSPVGDLGGLSGLSASPEIVETQSAGEEQSSAPDSNPVTEAGDPTGESTQKSGGVGSARPAIISTPNAHKKPRSQGTPQPAPETYAEANPADPNSTSAGDSVWWDADE